MAKLLTPTKVAVGTSDYRFCLYEHLEL